MQLLQIFKDITSHVQIKSSDFFVSHHNYQIPELPVDVIAQLQKLPQKIQDNYLSSLVQNLIHGIYYDGSLVQEKKQAVKTDYKIRLEKTAFEVDWEFYERLHKNNKGKGSFHPNFRVLRQEADGSLAVQHVGVTLHIQPDHHLQFAERSATVGDLVAVSMPPSQLKLGYYTAIGDAVATPSSPAVRVYFNFSPEGAVAVMKTLTTQLNALKILFTFLVSYNPSNYGGCYSGFLRFYKDSYELVRQVLQTVYAENQSHFQSQVPIFTKVLAPGLALAEEPKQQFRPYESFGRNRCQIVANALLEAHKNGDESPEARMKYILKHLDSLGIELDLSYLNPNSEDIYTLLQLS